MKETATIYIRETPAKWGAKVSQIIATEHLRNGELKTRNDVYLEIFEKGLDTYNTKKK